MYLEKEIVICSAVLTDTAEVIRCHRHHHGFMAIEQMGKKRMLNPRGQGFVTSRNRYVSRKEAREIQDAAGIPSFCEEYRSDILFSEDLY